MAARVTLRGITQRFGDVEALDLGDLDVDANRFVSVIGPSGCGKTTLLRIIAGLESPTGGTVDIDGATAATARRDRRIGWVPQSPALLPWRTVRQNALLLTSIGRTAPVDRSREVDRLLASVGLSEFADALPHELSGGMQQRVALVRAFALDAPLLLMDEPFAALDEITRSDMRHLLAELRGPTGVTVVFVTHSVSEAVYLSDRVVVLGPRPGRVVADVEVDLPRPRRPELEDSTAFFAVVTRLRHELHLNSDPLGASARGERRTGTSP